METSKVVHGQERKEVGEEGAYLLWDEFEDAPRSIEVLWYFHDNCSEEEHDVKERMEAVPESAHQESCHVF